MDSTAQFLSVFGWIVGGILAYTAILLIAKATSRTNQRMLWQDFSKDSFIYNPDDWS